MGNGSDVIKDRRLTNIRFLLLPSTKSDNCDACFKSFMPHECNLNVELWIGKDKLSPAITNPYEIWIELRPKHSARQIKYSITLPYGINKVLLISAVTLSFFMAVFIHLLTHLFVRDLHFSSTFGVRTTKKTVNAIT